MNIFKPVVFKLLILATLLSSGNAIAKKGAAVPHKHGDRLHEHPLPKEGINHIHGNSNKKSPDSSEEWLFLAGNAYGTDWEIKKKSLRIEVDAAQRLGASFIARVLNRKVKASKVEFFKFYVRKIDCEARQGSVYESGLNGGNLRSSPFIFNGGNIVSAIAEELCFSANRYNWKSVN